MQLTFKLAFELIQHRYKMPCCVPVLISGTRGAVLHHSAETVLCLGLFSFSQSIILSSKFFVFLNKSFSQSISSKEREPSYGVERALCAFRNHYLFFILLHYLSFQISQVIY